MTTSPTRPEFPAVDPDLLAALEAAFPDRTPDGGLSNDEIRERIGEARVVRFLRRQRDRQAAVGLASVIGGARVDAPARAEGTA